MIDPLKGEAVKGKELIGAAFERRPDGGHAYRFPWCSMEKEMVMAEVYLQARVDWQHLTRVLAAR